MEVLKLLIVCAIISSSNGSSIEDSIKTLENLLVNFNFSLTINAFLCWESGNFHINCIFESSQDLPPDYAIQLTKLLNERNFMVAIQNPTAITELPVHQHNNFIVFDFACENAKQLLDRVRKKNVLSVAIAFNIIWSVDAERV
jgi:hypothetical protein